MSMTNGTSRSCISRISTDGNSSACFTLDTGEHLTGKFEVLPCLAFFRRRAQQIRRVIGHHERNALDAEFVDFLAQAAECNVRAQQVMRGDTPDDQYELRF